MMIPIGYLDFAHGPAAESDHAPARRLFELPVNRRGQVDVDLSDLELREELRQVAELYEDGRFVDVPRRHVGTARRILDAISLL